MTKRVLLAALVGANLALAGCTQPGRPPLTVTTDAEVAAKCTPVEALLSKNYTEKRAFDATVINSGTFVEYKGAVLESADAKKVVAVDSACRAWVKGAMDDATYAEIILTTFVGSALGRDESGSEFGQRMDEIKAQLADLRTKGLLPSAYVDAKVEEQAAILRTLTEEQREAMIDGVVKGLEPINESTLIELRTFQSQMATRLDRIEARLPSIEQVGGTAVPIPREPENILVFFSTDSAELTFSALQSLDRAASPWATERAGVQVIGYADPRGDNRRNRDLSLSRAQVVAAYLRTRNVNVVEVKGMGSLASGSLGSYDQMRVVEVQPAAAPH